jgi:hypothetical protein
MQIEGRAFDFLAPTTGDVRLLRARLRSKALVEDADRVVVNLDDSTLTAAELEAELRRRPVPGLREVFVLRDGDLRTLVFA